MDVGDWQLRWIVCHRATRSVSAFTVDCPMRGRVSGTTCLGCRFLTTSSIERSGGPWCEAGAVMSRRGSTPVRRRVQVAVPVWAGGSEPTPPPISPLELPVLVPAQAVRHAAAVPSGHGIGK